MPAERSKLLGTRSHEQTKLDLCCTRAAGKIAVDNTQNLLHAHSSYKRHIAPYVEILPVKVKT